MPIDERKLNDTEDVSYKIANILDGIMNPNVDQELLMAYLNIKQKKSLEAHREA